MPWELTGNAGTNPVDDFLGTTDNRPLAIRTNNAERIRVTTEGNLGLGTNNPITDVPGGRALHIDNPTGASVLRLGDGSANGQQWEWQSTVVGNQAAMNLSNLSRTIILEGSAPTPYLTVLANRNVGIGATQPTHRLTLGSGNIGLPNADRGLGGNLYFGGITDAGQTGLRLFGGLVNGAIPAGFIDVRTTDPTDGLRIRVDTDAGGTERMRITAGGTVAVNGDLTAGGNVAVTRDLEVSPGAGGMAKIGVFTVVLRTNQPPNVLEATPCRLHVDHFKGNVTQAVAIHSGGDAAGYSFASRDYQNFRWDGTDGQRWVWYATSHPDGTRSARLWSQRDTLFVTYAGQLVLPDLTVPYPQVPIGNPVPGELVLGGTRTSIRGFDGAPIEPPLGTRGIRRGDHWIRTNGSDYELWMGFRREVDYGTSRPGGPPPPRFLKRTIQAAVPWFAPSYNSSSDARLKTNVRQIEGALENLERIRGIAFEWAETKSPNALGGVPGEPSIGVIAQEVEEVFPEVVSTYGEPDPEDKEEYKDYKAVDYSGLTSVLIEAVKELKAQNEALRSRIEALERA
jgi:Chaperone of endosialidase